MLSIANKPNKRLIQVMQTIYINELKLEAIIGTAAWERQIKQLLCLDVELRYDVEQAIADDNLQLAVDYTQVADAIKLFIQTHQFKLLETLAAQLAHMLLTEYPIQWLRLKLAKPGALSQAKEVGVIIERSS